MRIEAGDAAARGEAKAAIADAKRVARVVAIQRTEIHQLIGRIHHALGRTKAAHEAWRASLAAGERMGTAPEVARTYATIAERLGGGRLDGLDAATYRARAQERFDALALAWDLTRLRGLERAA